MIHGICQTTSVSSVPIPSHKCLLRSLVSLRAVLPLCLRFRCALCMQRRPKQFCPLSEIESKAARQLAARKHTAYIYIYICICLIYTHTHTCAKKQGTSKALDMPRAVPPRFSAAFVQERRSTPHPRILRVTERRATPDPTWPLPWFVAGLPTKEKRHENAQEWVEGYLGFGSLKVWQFV